MGRTDLIDYYDFIMNMTKNEIEDEAEIIKDTVVRKVAACKCQQRYFMEKVENNKYKFGDNQFLRLVRILRSTVMVRVGGGWMDLDEFLSKNDPCRSRYERSTITAEFITNRSMSSIS